MHNFFTSIEFYVIACVVAAAIVIFSAMPKQVGEARQFLLGGLLYSDSDDNEDASSEKEAQSMPNTQNSIPINKPNNTANSRRNNPFISSTSSTSNISISAPDEPSIVEVTETGYRTIPSVPVGKSGKQRKNQNQPGVNPNTPRWINGTAEGEDPSIDLLCLEDGTVKLIRKGLNGLVTSDGAVSLACILIGFDLTIEERIVYGGRNLKDPVPTEAVFSLEFLAPNEHYHIHYNSDTIHRMTAFTLATKDGMHIVKTLT